VTLSRCRGLWSVGFWVPTQHFETVELNFESLYVTGKEKVEKEQLYRVKVRIKVI